MKQAVVTFTCNELIGHKNWAYGRGTGTSLQACVCAAIRDALKHPNFKGKRLKTGKVTFAISEINNNENTNEDKQHETDTAS